MYYIVKIIMKSISSDITQYFKIIHKPMYVYCKLHVIADSLAANSCITCYNNEIFTEFVWPLNFHYEKNNSDV